MLVGQHGQSPGWRWIKCYALTAGKVLYDLASGTRRHAQLRTVAVELVEEAQSLVQEVDEFDSPPSRAQIDRVQESLTQRRLNRSQTETDTWSEEKEAV